MRKHTGPVFCQLTAKGGNGDSQTFAPGKTVAFTCAGMPPLVDGSMCAYLLGIVLTFTCDINSEHQTEGGPLLWNINRAGRLSPYTGEADVVDEDFDSWLLDSVELRGCLHGTPISHTSYKGVLLHLMEFVSGGYEYFGEIPAPLASGYGSKVPGGTQYTHKRFVPLSHLLGANGHHTALPAVFYDGATFELRLGPGSADGSTANTNTLQGATITAEAVLLGEPEVRVGPAQAYSLYRSAAGGSSEHVTLDNFGLQQSFEGTEVGAGIDFLAWLTGRVNNARDTSDTGDVCGSGYFGTLNRFQFPFRGQTSCTDLSSVIPSFRKAAGLSRSVQRRLDGSTLAVSGGATASGYLYQSEVAGFPYSPLHTGKPGLRFDKADPLFFPIYAPGRDLGLTKIRFFEQTQKYQLGLSSGTWRAGTDHLTLAHQFHSWTPAMWDAIQARLVQSGVCRAVLGSDVVTRTVKLMNKNPMPENMDLAKARLLPMRFVKA